MNYNLKQCLKNEKYKGKELRYLDAITIAEIKTNTLSGKPIVIPPYTVLRRNYNIYENNYHFEVSYYFNEKGMREHSSGYTNFVISEEETNKNTIIIKSNDLDLNDYIGIEIVKGMFSVYNSYTLFDKHKKKGEYRYNNENLDYAIYIDIPLKQLFLYDRAISNFFIEKTIPILKDFVNAFTKSSSIEQAKDCMKSMNEYLLTTLKTIRDLSKKTEVEAIEVIKKQNETEKFLENMRYRNEVAKYLQNC